MKGYRPVDIANWEVTVRQTESGDLSVRPVSELGAYPARVTDRLDYWASVTPDRAFLAKRRNGGAWQFLTYAEFRTTARSVAQWLLDAGLTADRPIAILSGNDLEHAVLGMAAMYAGIPYAPVSPAYSLLSTDFSKLRYLFEQLQPGLVFASDGIVFGPAISTIRTFSSPVVVTTTNHTRGDAIPFAALSLAQVRDAVAQATETVTADTVAKVLFTSGSTGLPKGVINTHRMLCSNQEMMRSVFRFTGEEPPVICDWLPWNHTFGGNHNFGLVLYNGGTLYIDDGKPMGPAFAETVRNLREIAPTVYFNVPRGYEALVEQMKGDAPLRKRFFSRLQMTYYAAASLSQSVWDSLDELAMETCGERIVMLSGLGSTETAPFALCANPETARAGVIGTPVPGVELKLVPASGKWEARLRGPNITPGYWRQPDLSAAAFDEDGFYRLGDALRCLDPDRPERGFVFDGRIAEDFKLSTGTWVSVGPLRSRFLLHATPWVRDIVLAGHDRDELTALIFPDPLHLTDRATFSDLLRSFAAQSAGSSTRIVRVILLDEPPSMDAGEMTDKGSINQHAVLKRRSEQVERLYRQPWHESVISI